MENSYGIGVANKYSVFLDEDVDPYEILENAKKEKEEKKAKIPGKENKSSAKTTANKPVKKSPVKEAPVKSDPRTGE